MRLYFSLHSVSVLALMVTSAIYMITLKYFAKVVAWASIFLIFASLVGIGVYMLLLSDKYP